jgi:hypothetical protein
MIILTTIMKEGQRTHIHAPRATSPPWARA